MSANQMSGLGPVSWTELMGVPEKPVRQHQDEGSRTVVGGRRTDDGDQCTLVAVCETGGTWALYPHGWGKFGVRLARAEALKVARAILAGES